MGLLDDQGLKTTNQLKREIDATCALHDLGLPVLQAELTEAQAAADELLQRYDGELELRRANSDYAQRESLREAHQNAQAGANELGMAHAVVLRSVDDPAFDTHPYYAPLLKTVQQSGLNIIDVVFPKEDSRP
jgi:hypothetical protein